MYRYSKESFEIQYLFRANHGLAVYRCTPTRRTDLRLNIAVYGSITQLMIHFMVWPVNPTVLEFDSDKWFFQLRLPK